MLERKKTKKGRKMKEKRKERGRGRSIKKRRKEKKERKREGMEEAGREDHYSEMETPCVEKKKLGSREGT